MQLVTSAFRRGTPPAATETQVSEEDAVIVRQLQGPTLLPTNVASLVTAASLAARISLKASALFLEALLEGARYSSLTGLGITRRALIGAISSARGLQYLQERMGLSTNTDEDAYFRLLDHYTSCGIYVIHHSFSLVELFTMSGFSLASNLLTTTASAAEETVRAFDGIFGSNESSRALAAIITMIRKEIVDDPNFPIAEKSLIGGLTAITKALTAYVCLQVATRRQTLEQQRLRVVIDCTVLLETSQMAQIEPPNDPMLLLHGPTSGNDVEPPESPGSRRHSIQSALSPIKTPGRRASLASDKYHSRLLSEDWDIGSVHSRLGDRQAVHAGSPLDGRSRSSLVTLATTADDEVIHNLELMINGVSTGAAETELPADVCQAIDKIVSTERALPATTRLADQGQGPEGRKVELVRSRATSDVYEIETVTTTTEIKTIVRVVAATSDAARALAQRGSPSIVRSRSSRDLTRQHTHEESYTTNGHGQEEFTHDDVFEQQEVAEWAQVEHGVTETPSKLPPSKSIGAFSCAESVEDPDEGQRKLGLVLKTMSQRFIKRKQTIRQSNQSYTLADQYASYPSSPSPDPPASGSVKRLLKAANKRSKSRVGDKYDTSGHSGATPVDSSLGDLRLAPFPKMDDHHNGLEEDTSMAEAAELSPRRASARSVRKSRAHLEATATSAPTDELSLAYPKGHLVTNLRRFVRYSTAAYGQSFLRIFGFSSSFNFPSTADQHADVFAFSYHTGVSVDCILLSSAAEPALPSTDGLTPIVHYVTVDHQAAAIVLTCRGTLGLSDLLTDLTAHYDSVTLPHDPETAYFAHSGMLKCAKALLSESSTVHQCLKRALLDYPTYGLVLCGHSLGGGIAALLSILLSTPPRKPHGPFVTSSASGLPVGRPIHCFVYGPPSVTSLELSLYAIGLVTCLVNNTDVVPSISLGMTRDLKIVASTLWNEPEMAEEVIGRVIGLYQARRRLRSSAPVQPSLTVSSAEVAAGRTLNRALASDYDNAAAGDGENEELAVLADKGDVNLWSAIKTIRAACDSDKTYPPGQVYVVTSQHIYVSEEPPDFEKAPKHTPSMSQHREARRVILREVEDVSLRFSEPQFSRSMFSDHFPSNYEAAIELLAQAVLPPS